MKRIYILSAIAGLFFISHAAAQSNIILPQIKKDPGMNIIQAMETRAETRAFKSEKEVPLEAISFILWAGNGIIVEEGTQTAHGYDAVTGATNLYRHTTPWGWGQPYIHLYLILSKGIYEYLPKAHELRLIKKNADPKSLRSAGMIVIVADFNEIHSSHSGIRDVAHVSAGSAAQNIYVAGAAYGIQTFTHVFIGKKRLTKLLNLPDKAEPLVTIAFGYAR